MRINQPVTQQRVPVAADATILSTTDPKGRITYINEEFELISGYNSTELLGQPHNIMRHPDRPRAAYQQMWSCLLAGRSWMGMVKNRCKNGDYYWGHAEEINANINNIDQLAKLFQNFTEQAGARVSELGELIEHAARLARRFAHAGGLSRTKEPKILSINFFPI